jgi:hypothetical protein
MIVNTLVYMVPEKAELVEIYQLNKAERELLIEELQL